MKQVRGVAENKIHGHRHADSKEHPGDDSRPGPISGFVNVIYIPREKIFHPNLDSILDESLFQRLINCQGNYSRRPCAKPRYVHIVVLSKKVKSNGLPNVSMAGSSDRVHPARSQAGRQIWSPAEALCAYACGWRGVDLRR